MTTDNNWSPRTLYGYEEQYKAGQGKKVGLVLNEGKAGPKVVWQLVNELFQEAQDYFTQDTQNTSYSFSTALCAILRWPNSVKITKVSIRGEDEQRMPIGRSKDFLEYIRNDGDPWIWIETSVAFEGNFSQNDQVDYARHSILQLEAWVETLSEEDVVYATSLFNLLRRNHRRSRDFVEDLTALFAPFRQRNSINSERSRSLLETFEDQMEDLSHASHLDRIEGLAAELEGEPSEDAKALLRLVRRGFGTCRDYMDELKVIFGPLQQRNTEELERAVQIKKIFEAIDKETEVIEAE